MNDAQYYMRVRGRVQGPFDQEKLQSFSRRGQLSRMHEVSTDGINWARASNFPELFVGTVSEQVLDRPAPAPQSAPAATSQLAVPAAAPPVAAPASQLAVPPPAAAAPVNPPAPPVAAAPPAVARPEWWYSLQGKQQGPVEFAALQQLTASGQLGRHDFVWKSGMTGWRPAAEVSGLTFAGIQPPRSDYQSLAGAQADPIEEMLYRTALRLRPRALLLAIVICLSAGGCCLWSLWQIFFAAVRDAHAGWSLLLGALGLVESGVLAGVAILLSVHAGRLAGLRHSRQLVVLDKALAALRPFWLLAVVALLLALVLVSLFLATLPAASTPDAPAPAAAAMTEEEPH